MAACSRGPGEDASSASATGGQTEGQAPRVTISSDQQVSPVGDWRPPAVAVEPDNVAQLKLDAAAALEAGALFGEDDDAIPLYLALRKSAPDDAEVAAGFTQAVATLMAQGNRALDEVNDDPANLRRAYEIAAVARRAAPADAAVTAYLTRVDRVEQAQQADLRGEQALAEASFAQEEDGEAEAIGHFRRALEFWPGDARARQGLAAVESTLIRYAERAADAEDFPAAQAWLSRAAKVRPEAGVVREARVRLARQRGARVGRLRDLGIAALTREDGLEEAREHLATLLRIAPPGDPAGAELRERIDLATHYGLFRPGQVFTEALRTGGRGPEMLVIPHGAFRMGAAHGEDGATAAERPARNVRFDRGLAVSRHEITVGEFRRFVQASSHRTRASRRGYSTAYDERSGNLVRRGGVDWSRDYAGNPADEDLPVVHVSARDAQAYADWLSEATGHRYRLPSEAEFEYMLRAGSQTRFPWGDGTPPDRAGNFTGALDTSPSGRNWRNAFEGYGDGAWGPAPVGSFAPNAYGLHDLAGNVSEWVADCWHDTYRRAPADGRAWVNPGCATLVVRGGSWASSPVQTRSAWRVGSDADTTNARVGFRVVREI